MSLRAILIASLLAVFGPAYRAALAETFHVLDTEFIGDFENEAKAFKRLIIHELGKRDDAKVVKRRQSATTVLLPKIIETGDAYILFLDSLDKSDDVLVTKSIKVLSGDDLDIAAERLVTAMLESASVDETIRVGAITQTEQHNEHRRRRARSSFFVGISPAVASGLGTSDQLFGFNLGLARQTGSNILRAEIQTHNGLNGNNASFSGVGLGLSHVLTKKDISPVFHGGLLYVGASPPRDDTPALDSEVSELEEDDGRSGFALRFGTGLFMFQTSTVHLETSLMVNVFLSRIATGVPAVYGLNVNLYFGGS